jgi:DnaJ-domain-containing protein 1
MPLLALLGAILLLFSIDLRKALRDRRQWPLLAAALLGLLLVAKGKVLIGAALVLAVAFWMRAPRWRRQLSSAAPAPAARLDRSEACDLLGVAPDADRATILAAHRRLIARNHPDQGGTEGLAARLNAARDALLQQARH